VESVIAALVLAYLTLIVLWRDAVRDARYHEDWADHYRQLWYREMDRHTERRDPADWWKDEDA
jgi:hypothetical protein